MHYYKFEISVWNLHTAHLTLVEEAVYRRLIDHYYDTEAPIGADYGMMIRRLRLENYQDEVQTILNEFFTQTDKGWVNKHCDEKIKAYKNKKKVNKTNGKSGGRPKKPIETDSVIDGLPVVTLTTNNKQETKNKDKPASRKKENINFSQYLENCKINSQKPIAEDHPVFTYAKEIGLPHDFLRLQWLEFKERYLADEDKTYKAWPTVFAKSVRDNWFRLWMLKDDQYVLTTTGLQAQKLHKVAA